MVKYTVLPRMVASARRKGEQADPWTRSWRADGSAHARSGGVRLWFSNRHAITQRVRIPGSWMRDLPRPHQCVVVCLCPVSLRFHAGVPELAQLARATERVQSTIRSSLSCVSVNLRGREFSVSWVVSDSIPLSCVVAYLLGDVSFPRVLTIDAEC
jgi:hypothetical protein